MTNANSQLIVVKCKNCGKLYVPPKYMCTECENSEFEEVNLSGKGKITTTIRTAPLGFEDQAPYEVVIIRLDEGINVPARIVSSEGKKSKIDDEVSFVKKEGTAHWFKIIR